MMKNKGVMREPPHSMQHLNTEDASPAAPRIREDENSSSVSLEVCRAEGTNTVDQVPQGTIEQKIQQIQISANENFSSVAEEKGEINVNHIQGQQDGKNTFRERPSLNKKSNKEKLLKIGSLNVKYIETNEVYLMELLKECEILTLQESIGFSLSSFPVLKKPLLPTTPLVEL